MPTLDEDDRRVITEIDAYFADFVRSTGGVRNHTWLGGVRKRLVAGAIMGSNTIEGYSVDLSTAIALVDGAAISADVSEAARDAVTGYRDALTWVLRMPQMDFFSYGEMLLSGLHYMMTRAWPDKTPGNYRRGGIMVTGSDPLAPAYVGPAPEAVPELMRDLVEWLNRDEEAQHVLVRAALAHLNLVAIHPWRDGNGRMARCLQTLVIARGGRTHPEFCSIEEWLGHDINTVDYYRALRESTRGSYQPELDCHSWVRFCLRAHHLQAQIVAKRLQLGLQVWEACERLAAEFGLSGRSVSALNAAAGEGLRREVYQSDEGLSRDQAIRDIRRIERAGLVRSIGYGPTLRYLADGPLKSAADEVAASLTAPPVEPYGE